MTLRASESIDGDFYVFWDKLRNPTQKLKLRAQILRFWKLESVVSAFIEQHCGTRVFELELELSA
ncbi:MAG: hypothetical protein NZM06_02950 [Chloroherpetonaceae bacterium]|nr:hypothetical protein [Chloroherpetonaceae bacterium]MDW8437254.1 hypothetical protein [Chloroherpetonaceae bacterium]